MSEPAGQTTHPFVCKLPDGTVVGGSYDNISAVTIACALYGVIQHANFTTDGSHVVTVYDDAGTAIAQVGKIDNPPTQTGPVDPVPALASLEPDSSGNWTAEVRLLGSGFTQTSQVLANDALVSPVTFVSDTELRCIVPASAAGSYAVKVRNGSQDSNVLTFTAL